MTKRRPVWKSDHPIYRRISDGTKIFLEQRSLETLDWLWDSHRLLERFKSSNDFFDYSFTIAPAYKALEKWLLLLAPYLGVDVDTIKKANERGKLGLFLADDKIEKFFGEILEKLTIEADKKRELKTFVQSLNSTLKNFRHNPAHSGTVIDDVLKAESDFLTLLNVMDNITQKLISENIIPYGGQTEKAIRDAATMQARKHIAGRSMQN